MKLMNRALMCALLLTLPLSAAGRRSARLFGR
jgi:hypothetical protein